MIADVEVLLKKARSMGAAFRFEGDVVVVSAPHPLPSGLNLGTATGGTRGGHRFVGINCYYQGRWGL